MIPHRSVRTVAHLLTVAVIACFLQMAGDVGAASATILGWNNLGMHCMDSDYSVFSILPPYNTIEAQLIVSGRLVTNGSGYTVSYEAVADPDGSFNSTAMGKGNFYDYSQALYGAAPGAEGGLAGWSMPGVSNVPQAMLFENTNRPAPGVATRVNWFRAEGIPITPYDDAHKKNPYPLMRLVARNSANQPLATNDVVLPVSDEMDCRLCHASGTEGSALPAAGWVWDGLPERDYRLNILRLHDEHQFGDNRELYSAALAANHFNSAGLYRSVTVDNKPVLCASCHASEALGTGGFGSIPSLTASVHSRHAGVIDPLLKTTLEDAANRSACYRCHPGSTTRCLRGAMGAAVASDGSMVMQCQSCHGTMSQVGAATRVGWFMEPNCQSCHTGPATHNNGQIRYTSAFGPNGLERIAVDNRFGTQPNTPAPGISLFRFSAGHGGLQCEACHGSTHAEFPATHRNDNLRNIALQGHAGVMIECTSCHSSMSVTSTSAAGGPHGMHPIGQTWINGHKDYSADLTQCQGCHGTDYRGTVLSQAHATRNLSASFDGTVVSMPLFRGAVVGCYNCHQGPFSSNANTSTAPTVINTATNTTNDKAVAIKLPGTGTGLQFRVISQPVNGSVGINGSTATYFAAPGFTGEETFTYAGYDGAKNSNLSTGRVTVAQGPYSIGATPLVPPSGSVGWPVAFSVVAAVTNHTGSPEIKWSFGDGSVPGTGQFATHTYANAGIYGWLVVCTIAGVSVTNSGIISIAGPISLAQSELAGGVVLSWPQTSGDVILEASPVIGAGAKWSWVTNTPTIAAGKVSVRVTPASTEFFRLRRPW